MKQRSNRPKRATILGSTAVVAVTLLFSLHAQASTQLLLVRGEQKEHAGEYKGLTDLAVDPGVENAKVTIVADGQKLAEGLRPPYHVTVDFGPTAIEHKITITAIASSGRVQWHETINRGLLPLSVKIKPVDVPNRVFEVETTSPKDDPIASVELWDEGKSIATATEAPYRFTIPAEHYAGGFVQVTAKTKAGEEAADFWATTGEVHVEQVQVRTVPIFVSVVDDRNGETRDDVDRSLFRIIDNDSEGKIVEFGKAFDQPIAIALLLDASASMTYEMPNATKAAREFVEHTLKAGDKCSVTAVQEVPRRKQPLTGDATAVGKALNDIKPAGRTALYDAIGSAIRELRDEKDRRAIVILTDGTDTSSIASYEDIQKQAREAGIPIYAVTYDNGEDNQGRDIDRLKYLTSETGGFVALATQQNLAAKYHEIEKDLRAQFAIRYQITDYGKASEWRRVKVVLNSPRLTARTIRGYFTP